MGEHHKTSEVINRLSRIAGHVAGVKRMVEDGKACSDVLLQLAAIKGAVNQVSRVVLEDHMENCISGAADQGEVREMIQELRTALSTYLRQS